MVYGCEVGENTKWLHRFCSSLKNDTFIDEQYDLSRSFKAKIEITVDMRETFQRVNGYINCYERAHFISVRYKHSVQSGRS